MHGEPTQRLCLAITILAACSSHSKVVEPSPIAPTRVLVEHVETCPGARATWSGERADGNDTYSTLTVVADGSAKPITIDVENIPRAHWSFDIFSPDCRHVLLLESRTGPFHIVRVDNLARYAAGAPPDFVLAGEPEIGTGNFRDGRWISNREVDYAWGCCDPPIYARFALPTTK